MAANYGNPLSPQQIRFVEEYLNDPSNQTAAAKRAGYSPSSAKKTATSLLQDIRVQNMIEEARKVIIKKIGIDKERVLKELALIAFSKTDGIVTQDEDGDDAVNLKGIANQSDGFPLEVAVSTTKGSSKTKTVTVRSVKLADKISALDKIAKIIGAYPKEELEVSGKISLDKLIEASFAPDEESKDGQA